MIPKRIETILLALLLVLGCKGNKGDPETKTTHQDHTVKSTDGVDLFVREFQNSVNDSLYPYPLLLVHGGGPGVIASFDIDAPNGSFAKDLTSKGIKVYMMNIRGWESSTLPKYDTSDSTLIIGNHKEAYEDIKSVVDFIRAKEVSDKVSLFGWATGGHWGGYFASKNSKDLAHFISLNSLYGVEAPWELRHFFWQERDTTKFQRGALYRTSNKEGLVRKWMSTIPTANKNEWRDSLVMEGYRNTAISFGNDTTTMTVPGGYREESFYMSLGKKYWSAEDIGTPSLVLRTSLDFWSRPEDLEAFEADLSDEVRRRIVEIPGTHYVFLDKMDRGKQVLIEEITEFIKRD